jgi:hypothetical protein
MLECSGFDRMMAGDMSPFNSIYWHGAEVEEGIVIKQESGLLTGGISKFNAVPVSTFECNLTRERGLVFEQ